MESQDLKCNMFEPRCGGKPRTHVALANNSLDPTPDRRLGAGQLDRSVPTLPQRPVAQGSPPTANATGPDLRVLLHLGLVGT